MISIITCTGRTEPLWEEFIDSLVVSLAKCPHPAELIVVDMKLWDDDNAAVGDRREKLERAVKGRISYRHVPPKPCPWQGRYRKTKRDYSAHNCARNTGIALARGGYIVMVDDCIVVDEYWYTHHFRSAIGGTAMAGAFKSYDSAVIERGQIVSGALCSGQDTRLDLGGTGMRPCTGAWLWGLACGFPLKYLLMVDGYDEIYNSQSGGDDCDLGLRVERAGCKVFYNPECFVYQIMTTHEAICNNEASGWPKGPDKQKELQLRSGRVAYSNEMLIQNLLDDKDRIWTVGNEYPIKDLRERALLTGTFPTEFAIEKHWVDGQPLSEM